MKFSVIESRIIEVLKDGNRHHRDELLACLQDELAPMSNLHPHICRLRKKLEPRGQGIVCELYHRTVFYRQIRFLGSNWE